MKLYWWKAAAAVQMAFYTLGDWVANIGVFIETLTGAEAGLAQVELDREQEAVEPDELYWMDEKTKRDLGR